MDSRRRPYVAPRTPARAPPGASREQEGPGWGPAGLFTGGAGRGEPHLQGPCGLAAGTGRGAGGPVPELGCKRRGWRPAVEFRGRGFVRV